MVHLYIRSVFVREVATCGHCLVSSQVVRFMLQDMWAAPCCEGAESEPEFRSDQEHHGHNMADGAHKEHR